MLRIRGSCDAFADRAPQSWAAANGGVTHGGLRCVWPPFLEIGLFACDPSIPPEEFLGPSGPKLETELKMSSRGLPAAGPKKLKKSRKRVKPVEKELKFPLFDSFSTLFLTFGAPGLEGPGNSFSTKGPRTPLGGWKGRNFSPFSGGSKEHLGIFREI